MSREFDKLVMEGVKDLVEAIEFENLNLVVYGDDKQLEIFSKQITKRLNNKVKEFNEVKNLKFNWKERMFGNESFKRVMRIYTIAGEIVGYCELLLDTRILEEESKKYITERKKMFDEIVELSKGNDSQAHKNAPKGRDK